MSAIPGNPVVPAWTRPVPRSAAWIDPLLAAALAGGMVLATPLFVDNSEPHAPIWVTLIWSVALNLPLVVRRRWPAAAAIAVTAIFIAGQVAEVPERLFSQITLVVALYSLMAWSSHRQRAFTVQVALASSVLVWMIAGLVALSHRVADAFQSVPYASAVALTVLTNVLALAAAFALGELSWQGARRLAAQRERTTELVAERERTAQQAALVERIRIARELHDVVAHRVSLIGVQAGAARLNSSPDEAGSAAFRAIESNAREAVAEMRNLLGVLRDDPDPQASPDGYSSTLSTGRLPELLSEFEGAGRTATLSVTGSGQRLPAVVDAALYRVAQEALTNVLKHAARNAVVRVHLHIAEDRVMLAVSDFSESPRPSEAHQAGLGHRGMRERIAALGGSVEFLATASSFEVRCEVPL